MTKVNIKLLISTICIIFICILTVLCFYINDDSKMINFLSTRGNRDISNDIEVVEINSEENDNSVINSDVSLVLNNSSKAQEAILYDGMTMTELANKLDRSFKNELSGKGYLYASYSLEKGVDPYLAAAISLEETGCNFQCSSLLKTCNNVGGMKGSGCGAYGRFATLDDGIRAFIDNISKNYVSYGLTTADTMHHKYAENPLWATNVNRYIVSIKNS